MSPVKVGAPPGAASRPRLHVLVVEDDDMTRRAVATALRGAGLAVTELGGVEQAVEFARSPAWNAIDVGLFDVRMAGGGVHAIVSRLDPIRFPFVLLSGVPSRMLEETGRQLAAVAWHRKPVEGRVLIESLMSACKRRWAAAGEEALPLLPPAPLASVADRYGDVLARLRGSASPDLTPGEEAAIWCVIRIRPTRETDRIGVVADRLGISRRAAEKRLNRAREKLRASCIEDLFHIALRGRDRRLREPRPETARVGRQR